mmetsp:Transcript_47273/g.153203  ORF Transcript_47273/g.153203 Transcript_47273/m.153203 type:complete len:296 (+) Transcript_47273:144-1031(+)
MFLFQLEQAKTISRAVGVESARPRAQRGPPPPPHATTVTMPPSSLAVMVGLHLAPLVEHILPRHSLRHPLRHRLPRVPRPRAVLVHLVRHLLRRLVGPGGARLLRVALGAERLHIRRFPHKHEADRRRDVAAKGLCEVERALAQHHVNHARLVHRRVAIAVRDGDEQRVADRQLAVKGGAVAHDDHARAGQLARPGQRRVGPLGHLQLRVAAAGRAVRGVIALLLLLLLLPDPVEPALAAAALEAQLAAEHEPERGRVLGGRHGPRSAAALGRGARARCTPRTLTTPAGRTRTSG